VVDDTTKATFEHPTAGGNEPNERDADAEDEARDDVEDGRLVVRATT
jgi:hypothetical protein